jgi:hypothetical protein
MPNNIGLLSNRVKKNPATNADTNRYQYLDLENAEPDLGVPEFQNGIAASSTTGGRKWLYWSDSVTIDENNFIQINPLSVQLADIDGGFY